MNRRSVRKYNVKLQEFGKHWLHEQESQAEVTESRRNPAEVVEQCVSYIIHNLGDSNLCVNDVAAHFYLNPIYLNRIFRKERGIAISQFIIQERMYLSAELLKKPATSIISVANQVGYPNYSYFCTVFKKYYNCTPSQYRQIYR